MAECLQTARALLHDAAPAARVPHEHTAPAATVLCDPGLLALPPDRGLELELELLCALCEAQRCALWLRGLTEALTCRTHVGEASEHGRAAAARVIADEPTGALVVDGLVAAPVRRWGRVQGALVTETRAAQGEAVVGYAHLAARMVGALLDQEVLRARNVRGEEALVHSYERRLTRLALDLHDGPLQDIAALGDELRDLRRGLAAGNGSPPDLPLAGRIDDLEAWLRAVDGELRRISATVGSPLVLTRSFEELLHEVSARFRERSQAQLSVEVTGALDDLSESQRIALLRIVQEALANAREHGEAEHVWVAVRAHREHVEAVVTDDGAGFEVDATLQSSSLQRSTAHARQGLAGMQERARLLGGACLILSRPGGPTTIAVHIPAWRPAG